MDFVFEEMPSNSSLIKSIWRTESERQGAFISSAVSHLEIVVTKRGGTRTLTLRGPETVASQAPIPSDTNFVGITFELGSHLPALPSSRLVDGHVVFAPASSDSFWLGDTALALPTFEDADLFVEKLARLGYLKHEPLVEAVMNGHTSDLSLRSVQRRFLRATGLTLASVRQIERARAARELLIQGESIAETLYQTGYSDQPHMTRSFKLLIGMTPGEVARPSNF